MKRMRYACSAIFILSLAGCASIRSVSMPVPVADASLEPGGTCNAEPARFLLGKTVDERLAEYARVHAGARVVRVIRPDVAHDDEKRPSRLDIEVDDIGRAVAVRCG